jgi:multidrug efflux pump subunit AcrB
MTSGANSGQGWIELEFPQQVQMSDALVRVSNALSQVPGYPENVDQPSLYSSSYSDNAFLYFRLMPLHADPLALDMDMLRDFAEEQIRPELEKVPGVSAVNINGAPERQVQIHVDPARLAQRGISLQQVRQVIRERNQDASGGDLDSGKKRYLLRMVGRFDDLEQLRQLIIKREGQTEIRLQDVATVRLDHAENQDLSYSETGRTLILSVQREAGSNVIDIKRQILPLVKELNQQLLQTNGLQLELFSDDVRYVEASVQSAWINLLLGAALATLVLYVFLRNARITLIGVMGIPLCTLAAFAALMLFGRTINVISLAGIAFAIGMTIDNSIVVLESIDQARKRGLNRIDAAIRGVTDVWPSVLASTLTTVLVFVPVLLIEQEAGQLYSDIAIAIAAAIMASMLVAVFVLPAAVVHWVPLSHQATHHSLPVLLQRWLHRMIHGKTRQLTTILMTSVLMLGGAWWWLPPAEYLPEGEEPKAFTSMVAPAGYNLVEMSAILAELRPLLAAQVNADPTLFERGERPLPALKYFSLSLEPGYIGVMSEPLREQDLQPMMDALTELFQRYPAMQAYSSRGSIISSNDGGSRAVVLDFSGNDLTQIYQAANAASLLAEQLFEQPQVYSDPGSLVLEQPLWQIRPYWSRLAEQGFSAEEFGYAVSALSDGAYVDEFILDDRKVDMFLYGLRNRHSDLNAIGQLPLVTPAGHVVPLQTLAELKELQDSDSIRRVDGRRTVSLYIIPPRHIALETAVAQVRQQLLPQMQQQGMLPSGVQVTLSGAADQLAATKQALSENFFIAVLIIYLLLVAVFTHWGYPLLVLLTIPLGLAGGVMGLALFNAIGSVLPQFGMTALHQPLDMITMLGFLILLGTVVNNPILIVEQCRKHLQQGQNITTAVQAAVDSRYRPIVMTTATTLFGLLPLVLVPGAGNELYRGIGIVVLSGLLCSTVISLTFLPAVLTMLLRQPTQQSTENTTFDTAVKS